MIKKLHLQNFKNFRDANIEFGPLTLLVGTNASGKSNLRDAFRLLHGISRGYTLAEVIGEKWIEGGVLQWKGIRGGIRDTAYYGKERIGLESVVDTNEGPACYLIGLDVAPSQPPRVLFESLTIGEQTVFDSMPDDGQLAQKEPERIIRVRLFRSARNKKQGKNLGFHINQPVVSQLVQHKDVPLDVRRMAQATIDALSSMRFLDLSPDAMRVPSLPGQEVLGDRGENLSSVLQAICEDPAQKEAALEWIRELTPLDVTDFEFASDQTGRVLVTLIEANGQKTSAYSASDGTLRFLAMIAAMLGGKPARCYFFEELENGIHPTRLHLLLQLIEQEVSQGRTQVIATTHSPQLLSFLSRDAQEHAALIYRLEGQPDARIKRILDIPDSRRVIDEQDLSRLHGTGWLEDAVAFLEGAPQA